MVSRGSSALALLALAITACANVAGIDADENIKLPKRGALVDSDAGRDDPVVESAEASTSEDTNVDASTPEDAAPAFDAAPKPGAWLQANGQDCVTFCSGRGMTNVASPDGAKCTSGENIPQSAITAGITYDKCFPSCGAHLSGQSPISDGKNCYASGQKKDGDGSDVTRGCFCQ